MARIRSEQGFGLVELLIALVVLNVGLLATVAAFTSGAFAINRADQIATAAVLADSQMEVYRGLSYDWIMLANNATLDSTYTSDPAYTAARPTCSNWTTNPPNAAYPGCSWGYWTDAAPPTSVLCTSSSEFLTEFPNACVPIRTMIGPDRHPYRIDTYISQVGGGSGRTHKDIVIVVRDGRTLRPLARDESVFDCSTAAMGSHCPTQ